MSELIMRAEQGVLGVMLRDPQTVVSLQVEYEDFGHPTHQAVFAALADLEFAVYDTEQQRLAAVARALDRPDVDTAWLTRLADTAPAAELAPEYARIVVQAAFDRDVADFAQPYRDSAQLATDPQIREALTRAADALDAQAAVFTPASTVDTDITVQVAGDVAYISGDVRVDLHREDQIIADLIQHPDQALEVAAWLDSEVFTSAQRKLTFELTVSLAYDGDPFDTVTLAWHVQRARDVERYNDPDIFTVVPAESDYAYLTRLHALPVPIGAAVVVGRDLLTEHVQATLALSAAEATERAPLAAAPQQVVRQTEQHRAWEPPLSPAPNADIRPIEL